MNQELLLLINVFTDSIQIQLYVILISMDNINSVSVFSIFPVAESRATAINYKLLTDSWDTPSSCNSRLDCNRLRYF